MEAADKCDGIQSFSLERFESNIKDHVEQFTSDSDDWPKSRKDKLMAAINADVLAGATNRSEDALMERLYQFQHDGFTYSAMVPKQRKICQLNQLTTSLALPSIPCDALVAGLSGASSDVFDDARALAGWLGFVSLRNAQTLRSYQKEVMRFRIFLETVRASKASHGTPVGDLNFLIRDASEMDVLLYEAHLAGKLKTGEALTPLLVPREILSKYGKKDQPFATLAAGHDDSVLTTLLQSYTTLKLKASSVNQALSILHALYEHLMRPDPSTKKAYVGANPIKRVKGSSNRMQRQTDRNFPIEAIQAMMQTVAQQLATKDEPLNKHTLIRRRWIAAMLFGLWGRRAEMARMRMCDFRHDGIRWGVKITRKGGKEQVLPVAPWVMKELMVYRQSLGMIALPETDDTTPCIGRLRRAKSEQDTPIDPDLIYREVCILAKDAAAHVRDRLVLPDLDDDVHRELLATRLSNITPHWFRHSGASISINTGAMSLENASKMLGHSSPVITAEMYYHPDENQISEGMEKLGSQVFKS